MNANELHQTAMDMGTMAAEDWELWQHGARLLLEHASEARLYVHADSGCSSFCGKGWSKGVCGCALRLKAMHFRGQ